MMRKQTTHMSETDFLIQSKTFRFIDVGGQKHYRGGWANFFDDSKALFFIVSMASYDQMMEEDPTVNRMADAMNLFIETTQHKLLLELPVILLLNKTDLATQKLPYSPLKKHFPDLSCKYLLGRRSESGVKLNSI